mmetsp:Transcript_18384/g.53032  ORF Transcript_18384/g.53032 Transcript_18384/m.53032 type:complete len:214 (-) Transcript_18384:77-718(-)
MPTCRGSGGTCTGHTQCALADHYIYYSIGDPRVNTPPLFPPSSRTQNAVLLQTPSFSPGEGRGLIGGSHTVIFYRELPLDSTLITSEDSTRLASTDRSSRNDGEKVRLRNTRESAVRTYPLIWRGNFISGVRRHHHRRCRRLGKRRCVIFTQQPRCDACPVLDGSRRSFYEREIAPTTRIGRGLLLLDNSLLTADLPRGRSLSCSSPPNNTYA